MYLSNPQANNFRFWMTDQICIFADIWGGNVDGWQNKFVHIWRSEHSFLIALDTFTYDYDMINKLFWSTSIFRASEFHEWIVFVVGYVCYAVLSPTHQSRHYRCFGPSWISITNELSAKHDNCSFHDWRCLYH